MKKREKKWFKDVVIVEELKEKKEKEIRARFHAQIEHKKLKKGKDLTKTKYKVGDSIRVVNLHGIKVKYPAIIRWIGILDEDKNEEDDKIEDEESTKKKKIKEKIRKHLVLN